MVRKRTTEWEFQGQVNHWLNAEIQRRPGIALDCATEEPSKVTLKRSDLIVWKNRDADDAFLEIELKQPTVPITDLTLFRDAEKNAVQWGAPYFAIWNMKAAGLYKTPDPGIRASPNDRVFSWPLESSILSVDDWLDSEKKELLHARALSILDKAWELNQRGDSHSVPIEASMFVDRVGTLIPKLKSQIGRS